MDENAAPPAVRRAARSMVLATVSLVTVSLACLPPSPSAPASRDTVEAPAALGLYVPAWDAAAGGPPTAAQVALGRALFFDTGMSRDGSTSCGTCHVPELAFSDGRRIAVGVGGAQGRRNSPTLMNRAYGLHQFWDGRAASLQDQVLLPIEEPAELGSSLEAELARLAGAPAYRRAFARAFGAGPDSVTLARALAAFVGSIFSATSPLDRYLAGDRTALTEEEIRGRRLFTGRAGCARCHLGANLTDEAFHNTGVAWRDGEPADSGRAEVTGEARDIGAFKTPTLREVPRTAPYMHDGSIETLEEVVDFYDRGGHPNPYLDGGLLPLRLERDEKAALVAFLRTLSGQAGR